VSAVTDAPPRPAINESAHAPRQPTRTTLMAAGVTVGVAALLVAVSFVTGGGVDETIASAGNTWTEIALSLLGLVAVSIGLLRQAPGERNGWLSAGLMGLLFALTAGSIAWSVAPDSSWLASGQMLAYLAVFAGAIMLARPFATRWASVLGALVLWSATLCLWSLVVKVFPASLAPGNTVGRLQAPFGYWNAIALCAAMGMPCCLWLGARRDDGRRMAALSAPALTLLVAVLVLSYSRSADFAAAVAVAAWLIFVPLRLRAIAVLAVGVAGGAIVSVWALTHRALHASGVTMALQDHAGHTFGIVILVVLVLVTILGIAVTESMDRTRMTPQTRNRIGSYLVVALAGAVVVAVVAVALSHRGLTGEISYRWTQLTNPQAVVSASSASRVLQFGSSRPVYWHEAIAVGDHDVLRGVGASGFSLAHTRYTTNPAQVQQAHSYVFETYADLGLLGLVVTAALLGVWLVASGRTLGLHRRGLDADLRPERIGLITLAALVLAFGIQGTLDWTWYFAGLSAPALLAAGWLAGRGRLGAYTRSSAGAGNAQHASTSILDRPGALMAIPLLAALVLAGCWMVWRPLHSAQLVNSAENTGNFADARAAQSADPFSLQASQLLSDLYSDAHRPAQAQGELMHLVKVQPDNPFAWSTLAAYEISRHAWRAAIPPLHQVTVFDHTADPLGVETGSEIGVVFKALHLP
jgi:hypothetical protein